jgi:hypothetical protein
MKNQEPLKYAVWFRRTDPKTKKVIDHGIILVARDKQTAEWHQRAYESSPDRPNDTDYLVIPKYE